MRRLVRHNVQSRGLRWLKYSVQRTLNLCRDGWQEPWQWQFKPHAHAWLQGTVEHCALHPWRRALRLRTELIIVILNEGDREKACKVSMKIAIFSISLKDVAILHQIMTKKHAITSHCKEFCWENHGFLCKSIQNRPPPLVNFFMADCHKILSTASFWHRGWISLKINAKDVTKYCILMTVSWNSDNSLLSNTSDTRHSSLFFKSYCEVSRAEKNARPFLERVHGW